MRRELPSRSPEETVAVGRALGRVLQGGDVVGLRGALGEGKTTFAGGILAGLGAEDPAASPSFVLIRETRGRVPIYHMDFYRLESEAEIFALGVADYFAGDGVTVIEWAERLGTLAPSEWLEVEILPGETTTERRLLFHPHGAGWDRRLASSWPTLATAARPEDAAGGAR